MIIGNCPVCGAEMRVGTDMTNADRIRAMTDEELADFLEKGCEHIAPSENCTLPYYSCVKCWLNWLKEDA